MDRVAFYIRHSKGLAALLVLLLLSMLSHTAAAQVNEGTSNPLSARVALGYASKAQYFREPQANYNVRGTLAYAFDKLHAFSLGQGLHYRKNPYEELYASDTSLSYSFEKSLFEFPESWNLHLSPSADIQLGTSEQSSARDRRYGVVSTGIGLSWSPQSWLNLGVSTGGDVYFYRDTISKYGEANERHSLSAGVNGAVSYQKLSLSQSMSFNQTRLYAGWEDIYTFSSQSSLGLKLPDNYSVSFAVVTSDDQLRYGRNQNFRMYDRDITRFSVSLSKQIL